MYVRKFEAETMEDALRSIKQELGPDAIILKTTTNKGLKGAFKKNKIEITAAISEKDYTKKSEVDHLLDKQQKNKFYNNKASYISNMINSYGKHRPANKSSLESEDSRPPRKEEKMKTELDKFLSSGPESENSTLKNQKYFSHESMLLAQREKIDELERKIFKLTKEFERFDQNEAIGIFQLRTMLDSLGINKSYIQKILKKAVFELSKEELEDTDLVFEFALREMLAQINIAFPLFGHREESKDAVVTVLISENSCGQTSTLYKIGTLQKESILVRPQGPPSFTENVLDLSIEEAKTIPDYIAATRRGIGKGQGAFLDYKCIPHKIDETKSFIDGLRRSFRKVEVLICLSAIHAETYNRRVIERYASLSDGLIITHLDLCLNYGSLFNIGEEYAQLPFKFFGTGQTIPEDLEAATAERILAGMFRLK